MAEEQEGADRSSNLGKKRLLMWIAVYLSVLAVATVAGMGVGFVIVSSDSGPQGPKRAAAEEDSRPIEVSAAGSDDFAYYDLDLTCNLNEPRMARYIRATISLAFRKEHASAVRQILEKRQTELKSWLIRYFADCTLEEVRGAKNLNRILREIRDHYNEMLWPNGKPLIVKVDYKSWAVQ